MEINNKKAYHNYQIIDKLEVGLVLQGNEVKSVRQGQASIKDSYGRFIKGELFLINMYIAPYEFEKKFKPDPTRQRKLLLTKSELRKLLGLTTRQGVTLVPLKVYLKNNHLVKVLLGLAAGKKQYEKKQAKKLKDLNREVQREYKLKLQ